MEKFLGQRFMSEYYPRSNILDPPVLSPVCEGLCLRNRRPRGKRNGPPPRPKPDPGDEPQVKQVDVLLSPGRPKSSPTVMYTRRGGLFG